MKINDLRDFSKDDVLSALGLTSKPSTSDRLLGALSIFGVGLLFYILLWIFIPEGSASPAAPPPTG